MNTKTISVLGLATLLPLGSTLVGQNSNPVVTPTSPAPIVANVSPPAVAVQTIYSARLPNAQELTDAAAKQGINVDRIEQTDAQVVVTYKYSDGQTKTVNYQRLPVASNGTTAATVTTASSSPPPTVVYAPAPPPRVVYYYDDYPGYYPYYPSYVYPRVSLGFGVGFGSYRGGGFYRGGFGHRWR